MDRPDPDIPGELFFGLSVTLGGVVYPVKVKQAVDPNRLVQLTPGAMVGVRVDQSDRMKVVIDWSYQEFELGDFPWRDERIHASPVGTSFPKATAQL